MVSSLTVGYFIFELFFSPVVLRELRRFPSLGLASCYIKGACRARALIAYLAGWNKYSVNLWVKKRGR